MANHTLEDIDRRMPVSFSAWKQDAERPITSHAEGTQPVQLAGHGAAAFLALASASAWRVQIEADLQLLAVDRDGQPLLSSFMPLSAFLDNLRSIELGDGGAEFVHALDRLRAVAGSWACAGADLVCFDGYLVTAQALGTRAVSGNQQQILEPAL